MNEKCSERAIPSISLFILKFGAYFVIGSHLLKHTYAEISYSYADVSTSGYMTTFITRFVTTLVDVAK